MALLKDFMCDNLRVRCFDTRKEMGDCAGKEAAEKIIAAAEAKMDDDSESIITNERYEFITGLLEAICW